MSDLVLTNANIILNNEIIKGSLYVSGGKIESVDSSVTAIPQAIDCEGDYLAPGFIELHTDNVERHLQPRPNSIWPVDAAVLSHDREFASVGITTVYNAVCVGDIGVESLRLRMLPQLCEALLRQLHAGTLKIDHYIHLRCEASYGNLLNLLDPLITMDRVRMISVMDHTPGQRQFIDIALYEKYNRDRFNFNDEELAIFMKDRLEDQKKYSSKHRRAVVERANAANIPLASHDDATEAHVSEAIRDNVVIAEFPTTIEAAQASSKAGLAVLMGGPNIVRGKSHSGNVSARELAAEGLLDIISSDYVPSSLLHAAVILKDTVEDIDLPAAIRMITYNPAKAINIEDRGEIAEGKQADLVRFHEVNNIPIIRDVWRAGKKIA